MATVKQNLAKFSPAQLRDAQINAESDEEFEAIGEVRLKFAQERLQDAVNDFIQGTVIFLDLIQELSQAIKKIGHAPELEKLLKAAQDIQGTLHGEETLPTTHEEDEIGDNQDEQSQPPDPARPLPAPKNRPESINKQPKTTKATTFEKIEQEYIDLFNGAKIRDDKRDLIARFTRIARDRQSRYEVVGNELGIPWWFVAGIHLLESGFNFDRHLHNGDPLTARTKRVPKGRPGHRKPPPAFSWEESAIDALRLHKLDNLGDWSLPRALYRWERFNGFGYRPRRIPSPYLWSFSTIYERGKFVADGQFDRDAVSQQCGAAVFLKQLNLQGHVALG